MVSNNIEYKHVLFKPWKGNDYETGGNFNKKLMILGLSHYAWPDAPRNKCLWTQYCVEAVVNGTGYEYFWPSVARTILGYDPNDAQRRALWHSVAFYNYIQQVVGDGPGIRPTKAMFNHAECGFKEVIAVLRPDVLLVFSYTAYDNLPPEDECGEVISMPGVRMETCYYDLGHRRHTLACRILHPRAGLAPARWYPAIKQAIADTQH